MLEARSRIKKHLFKLIITWLGISCLWNFVIQHGERWSSEPLQLIKSRVTIVRNFNYYRLVRNQCLKTNIFWVLYISTGVFWTLLMSWMWLNCTYISQIIWSPKRYDESVEHNGDWEKRWYWQWSEKLSGSSNEERIEFSSTKEKYIRFYRTIQIHRETTENASVLFPRSTICIPPMTQRIISTSWEGTSTGPATALHTCHEYTPTVFTPPYDSYK